MADSLAVDSLAAHRPRWWWALRVAWVVFVALRLTDFASSLPAYMTAARLPAEHGGLFTVAQTQALQRIGVSLTAYALASVCLFALCVLMATVIALFLFWRRSSEWMALVVGYFLVANPINSLSSLIPQGSGPSGLVSLALTLALGLPAILVSLGIYLLFPSGRFEPRWSWVLLPVWLAWFLLVHAQPELLHGPLALGYPVLYGGAILCQVYRYQRVSASVERQQTKWAATGLVIALLANQIFWLPQTAPFLARFPLFIFIALIIFVLSLMIMQVMFFIALQHYRLYDIDVFINRALVYSALTVTLAGVYLAGVVGVQTALNQFFRLREATYPPLIVVMTLVVAALFQPLRRMIQTTIDRRFYRTRYDAARTIAAFGAELRHDVNLEDCETRLLAAVEATMQPTQAFLWLREPIASHPPRLHESHAE